MIDLEHIKKLSTLARLELTPQELEGFQGDLSRILDYVGKLENVDTSSVSATLHATATPNILRSDTDAISTPEDVIQRMLDQAPERKNGYIKVKAVL